MASTSVPRKASNPAIASAAPTTPPVPPPGADASSSIGRRPSGGATAATIGSAPRSPIRPRYPSTPVRIDGMQFLVIDAPVDSILPQYIAELKSHNVSHLVRTCECTYDANKLLEAGIQVHDFSFADGDAPPKRVVQDWLALLDVVFGTQTGKRPGKDVRRRSLRSPSIPTAGDAANGTSTSTIPAAGTGGPCIAVHCQAGLGRAPALVAIALMERCGMAPLDAVVFIRERRKGAFNAKQMAYLESYRVQSKGQNCIIC